MSERFPQLTVGLLLLSLGLVISAWIGSSALVQLKASDHAISVVGSARKAIRADYAVWRCTVTAQQATLKDAYVSVKQYTATVQQYLKDKQLPDESVIVNALETSNIPDQDANGRDTGKIRAYRMTQRFEVRAADVARITQLAQESTDLINQGIPFESHAPEYLYTKLSELRVAMLAEASRDARSRAETIINSVGGRLGPVLSAKTGVFQITKPHSTEVDDYGLYDTTSIEKDITAVMTLTFSVK